MYLIGNNTNERTKMSSEDDFISDGVCIFGKDPCPISMIPGKKGCCVYNTEEFTESTGEQIINFVKDSALNFGVAIAFDVAVQLAKRGIAKAISLITTRLAVRGITRGALSAAGRLIPVAGNILELVLLLGLVLDLTDPAGLGKVAITGELLEIKNTLDEQWFNAVQEEALQQGEPIKFPIVLSPITQDEKQLETDINDIAQDKFSEIATRRLLDQVYVAQFSGRPDAFYDAIGNQTEEYFASAAGTAELITKLCNKYKGNMSNGSCTYNYSQCKALRLPDTVDDESGKRTNQVAAWSETQQYCYLTPYGMLKEICESFGTTYDFDLKMCVINKEYCDSKGLSYENGTCYTSDVQDVFEMIFGEYITRGYNRLTGKTKDLIESLIGDALAAEILTQSFWGVSLLIGLGVEIYESEAVRKIVNDAIKAGDKFIEGIMEKFPQFVSKLRQSCNNELDRAREDCLSGVRNTYENCMRTYHDCISRTPRVLEWTCEPVKAGCDGIISGVGEFACDVTKIVSVISCDGILL